MANHNGLAEHVSRVRQSLRDKARHKALLAQAARAKQQAMARTMMEVAHHTFSNRSEVPDGPG